MSDEPYHFIIPGEPIAKRRPRFARRGKFIAVINDQETEEGRFLLEIREQWRKPALTGPIRVNVAFYVSIPQSSSKKKAQAMREGKLQPTKRPDLDNCIKFFMDVMNGEVWLDDKQVVYLCAYKEYGDQPRTEITVREAE